MIGSGPAPCSLMIIGEGPGAQEDEVGLPFIGPSGEVMASIAKSLDIDLKTEAYITNVVACRPPQNRMIHNGI